MQRRGAELPADDPQSRYVSGNHRLGFSSPVLMLRKFSLGCYVSWDREPRSLWDPEGTLSPWLWRVPSDSVGPLLATRACAAGHTWLPTPAAHGGRLGAAWEEGSGSSRVLLQ